MRDKEEEEFVSVRAMVKHRLARASICLQVALSLIVMEMSETEVVPKPLLLDLNCQKSELEAALVNGSLIIDECMRGGAPSILLSILAGIFRLGLCMAFQESSGQFGEQQRSTNYLQELLKSYI